MRAAFSESGRERFAGRVECTTCVGVGALKEDRHQRGRAAAERVSDDHELRRGGDLGGSDESPLTLDSNASSTRISLFSTGFFSNRNGSS